MWQPSGEKGVVIAPPSLQLKPLSSTTPSKPPARRKPTARRKPILRHPADLRSLGFMTLFYGCLLTLWWFDAKIVSWGVPGYLLFTLIYGVQLLLAAVAAVISHNALHVPVFNSNTLQRAFQIALTGAYGQPVSVYQPAHNRSHHRHTGTRQDLMRPTKLQYKWQILNMLLAKEHAPGTTGGLKLAWNFYSTQWKVRPALVYTFLFEFVCAIALLVGSFYISPRKCLMYFFAPQHVSQSFINFINYMQHDGCDVDPDHKGMNHARNFTGWFFNYIFLNNGYHTIHHMKPGLHWTVLPEKHRQLVAPHIHPNLVQPCFRKYLWRALFVREDYLGKPVVVDDDGTDEPIQFDTSVVFETDSTVAKDVTDLHSHID